MHISLHLTVGPSLGSFMSVLLPPDRSQMKHVYISHKQQPPKPSPSSALDPRYICTTKTCIRTVHSAVREDHDRICSDQQDVPHRPACTPDRRTHGQQDDGDDDDEYDQETRHPPSGFPLVLVRGRQLVGCRRRVLRDGRDVVLDIVCSPSASPYVLCSTATSSHQDGDR